MLGHHAFTGRSGTMYGYEGLGCIYWHMVAKLLLAVQESVFAAFDDGAPDCPGSRALPRVRAGLGFRKRVASTARSPSTRTAHAAPGGAQQPGMTGQVKEEILTRWGELGVRVRDGLGSSFSPSFSMRTRYRPTARSSSPGAACRLCIVRGAQTAVRVNGRNGWRKLGRTPFDLRDATAVEASVCFDSP